MRIKKLLLFLILLIPKAVLAENTGSFEMSITPIVTYSVTISTPEGGIEFSSVEPNQSYVANSTVTIQNTGNVSADWKIAAFPLNEWQLGTTPGPDTVCIMGVLKTNIADSSEFDTENDVITGSEGNMKAPKYSVNQDGNNVPKNATRILAIRLDAPTDTSVDTVQKFRVEIKAYPSSTF